MKAVSYTHLDVYKRQHFLVNRSAQLTQLTDQNQREDWQHQLTNLQNRLHYDSSHIFINLLKTAMQFLFNMLPATIPA